MFEKPFIALYYELIHIHQDKSGKCRHARRFGSPSAGSEPRLYCIISARPFAEAGHEIEPLRSSFKFVIASASLASSSS